MPKSKQKDETENIGQAGIASIYPVEASSTPKSSKFNSVLGKNTKLLNRKFGFFAIVFALVLGYVIWHSFADSYITYNRTHCIDPDGGSVTPTHYFYHDGGCSAADINLGFVTQGSQIPPNPPNNPKVQWCALASNANSVLQPGDGPCPANLPPPLAGFTIAVSGDPNTIAQGQTATVKWNATGSNISSCQKLMAPNSPLKDANWTGPANATSSQQVSPTTTGIYLYGVRCFDPNGNKLGSATTSVQVNTGTVSSSGGTTSYSLPACVNSSGGSHMFVHSGSCTDAETAKNYISMMPFNWCAPSANKEAWLNDGPCPGSGSAQGLGNCSTSDQKDDNVVGDDNPTAPPSSVKPKLHALYVLPSDWQRLGLSRNYCSNGRIATALTATNAFLKWKMGTGKALRLDKVQGQIDVSSVVVPHPFADFAKKDSYGELINDLKAKGFNDPNKDYVVYYEGISHNLEACGLEVDYVSGPRFAVNYLRLQDYCGSGLTTSTSGVTLQDLVTLHEILHALGVVASCSPHYDGTGHVNDSIGDLMYSKGFWDYAKDPQKAIYLDANHDDYFSHPANGCFDLNTSPFLATK